MKPTQPARKPLLNLLFALTSVVAMGACGGGGGGSAEAAVPGGGGSTPPPDSGSPPSTGTPTTPTTPAAWGTPRASARVFISGHSLTDNPLGDYMVSIANSLGNAQSAKYNEQIVLGSPIRYRTDRDANWAGYSRGKNREGSNMNVINELRNPTTLGGDRYDTLVITENHNLLEMLQWESTPRNLRHFHERLLAGNAQGRTFFYESWKDIYNKADPSAWIAHERAASSAWQCIGARINTSLAAEGRADRIQPLPAGAALAALVERATTGGGVTGITGASTTETVNRLFSDAVHPTSLGMYYLALVTYASVYERSPVGAAAPSGISNAQARSLQEVAWAYVSNFYSNYQAPTLASCSASVATTYCPTYWNYRSDPSKVAACTATFLAQSGGNPLFYVASAEASYWYAAP